ncbi:MAG: heat-inducible transcription repressor HrcA [Deltaproteobacteria bacterium RIFCSPLOWO2_02_FULL_53_8]|nr:MAG: heat-inducible transcription repressor HrcA [Deltaproteobacteria bacterium RIFCSPLOWO2_02_FULL_53_8]
MDINSERHKSILTAVVRDYIRTAAPVGSKGLTLNYCLNISPATARSIMAELEESGYLAQPHRSAGRIPTEKGFRFYIDSLLEFDDISLNEKSFLRRNLSGPVPVDEVFTKTAMALASMTLCAGIMFVPKRDNYTIKRISLLKTDQTGVMVVIVPCAGPVTTRLVRMGVEVSAHDLERITGYLNTIANGMTFDNLREKIVEEMRKEKNLYDNLVSKALSIGAMAVSANESATTGAEGLRVEGKLNVLDQPEFRADLDRMKALFKAFEEKGLLLKILDKSLEESGMRIYLGSESSIKEFEGLGLVTAPYSRDGEVLGAIGVIGPLRMNYSRIIPLVNYTAGLLNKVF